MNVDKDIERCKELIKTEHSNWIGMCNQDAISNVLLELDKKDEIIKRKNKLLKQTQDRCADILKKLRNRVKEVKKLQQNPNYKALVTKQNKTLEERAETIKFLKSDCETWKKIAYKLAELINTHDIDEDVCKQMGKDFDCTLFNQDEKFCVQCIIDWAKREVKK